MKIIWFFSLLILVLFPSVYSFNLDEINHSYVSQVRQTDISVINNILNSPLKKMAIMQEYRDWNINETQLKDKLYLYQSKISEILWFDHYIRNTSVKTITDTKDYRKFINAMKKQNPNEAANLINLYGSKLMRWDIFMTDPIVLGSGILGANWVDSFSLTMAWGYHIVSNWVYYQIQSKPFVVSRDLYTSSWIVSFVSETWLVLKSFDWLDYPDVYNISLWDNMWNVIVWSANKALSGESNTWIVDISVQDSLQNFKEQVLSRLR